VRGDHIQARFLHDVCSVPVLSVSGNLLDNDLILTPESEKKDEY
jgi:hypothetical protein